MAEDYRRIADRIAADIASGRLEPGRRLPPQRVFARRRGIAGSTAGRVYGELVRRGLVVGEVGRGTFVRASPLPSGRALAEPATTAPVNLELNYPSAPGQSELLAAGLAPLLRPDVLAEATRTASAAGTRAAREAAAGLLATEGWRPAPDRLLFAGNARQAIAGALASLVPPGGRLGVESLTYPLVREIAARLGVVPVPLAMDEQGLCPDALAAAHRSAPLAAVYVQPTLHNPTSVTMRADRLRELADTVRDLGLPVVEDRIWSFLQEDGDPLAAYAPERTYVVDGLSKRVAPGLTVGFLVVPEDPEGPEEGAGRDEAAAAGALRSGGWTAGRFALEAAVRWSGDGTVARLVAAKRADAAERQRLVAEHLAGFTVRADPRAYYAWWELPEPWRADTFAAAAARRGIAVTPGPAFGAGQGAADAVRLGLASVPPPELARALRTLAGVACTRP
ncbi:GntR family transcriptional regulator [Streptomyces avermitilis]|uniref:GntR family transcriptional regulator n=1 Tax=Streptomyces avermitilis TaxID=33903 RepID=A0A4D4LY11_STRAX|nr:PLP-dependent aminotransferase family protein [Streptomyces avermitilis]KUN52803.1 GntR family transcriptional regulator [Streptomyces avermitilis]OOV31786.1 GntR family transcriptional regulator [Streptomyces avermitilis]BBJ52421.1 GntR family transcriptional regulator [Streptomyces avermitilis]GDY64456.1 GntR family transcriptional regulator [Streptomyces avermitilis]GDY84369.1 GntR family transcriptional regulator [Streptomyces avermitilis]